MELQVRGVNLRPTEPIVEHANRRFGFALDRLSHRIQRVIIKMSDPNAGGMMRCDVHVQLAGGAQPIIVEQSGSDLYGAIDRAADRVQTCVRRITQKTRRHR
jgi:ribosomal subunit interface protein